MQSESVSAFSGFVFVYVWNLTGGESLGLVEFYRKFVKRRSHVCLPFLMLFDVQASTVRPFDLDGKFYYKTAGAVRLNHVQLKAKSRRIAKSNVLSAPGVNFTPIRTSFVCFSPHFVSRILQHTLKEGNT